MSDLNSCACRMPVRRPQPAPDKVGRKHPPTRCDRVRSNARRQPDRCAVGQEPVQQSG